MQEIFSNIPEEGVLTLKSAKYATQTFHSTERVVFAVKIVADN